MLYFPALTDAGGLIGLLSPAAAAMVRTIALRAKTSTGLFCTLSLHVGHVYCGYTAGCSA